MKPSVLIIAVAGLTFLVGGSALPAGTSNQKSLEAKTKLNELLSRFRRGWPESFTLEQTHNPDPFRYTHAGFQPHGSLSKPTDLTSAYSVSGRELKSMPAKQQSAPPSHPDTAFVRSSWGELIRHIYSYNSSGKLTVDQEEILEGDGWAVSSIETRTYDPAGHMTSNVGTDHDMIRWRRTLSYDADGRVRYDEEDGRDWSTGQLELLYRTITAYDDAGNVTFAQYESRYNGEPMTGWRVGSVRNAWGISVDSVAKLTPSGWEMQQRTRSSNDSTGRWVSSYTDLMIKGEWTPSIRDTLVYELGGLLCREIEETWTDEKWVASSRSTTNSDEAGNLEVSIVERWDNEQWVNQYRTSFSTDTLNRSRSTLSQEWTGTQWRNTFHWNEVLGQDGRELSEADTNWSAGQLTGCTTRSSGYTGEGNNRVLLESTQSEGWNGGKLISGSHTKDRYDWLERQISSEGDTFDSLADAWLPSTLITWGYEAGGRLVSLNSFEWTNGSWGPYDYSCALYPTDPGSTLLLGPFTEVRFAYRQSASAVAPGNETVPLRCSLMQNYPNPFNPTTVISGQWTVTSDVRLVVYDVLGREVATLANGRYPAGMYSFRFDATRLASGVYYYRLQTETYSATKAMLLVR